MLTQYHYPNKMNLSFQKVSNVILIQPGQEEIFKK